MRKIFHKILAGINVFAILLTIIAYLSIYISPAINGIPALIGLAYPVLLIINILFIIYWLFRFNKKWLIINLFVFILGYSYLNDFIQIKFNTNKGDKSSSLKVMTYNARLFNYVFEHNRLEARNIFMNFFKKESPDILCIQEFYTRKKGELNNLAYMQEKIFPDYYFYFQPITPDSWGEAGVCIISKYPIINKKAIMYEHTSNLSICADICVNNDTIRVFNNHLESIRFATNDYKFVEEINLNIDSTKINEAKNIVSRLLKAFEIRAIQADTISTMIKKSPYKTIVCGDFNDTPISYTYHTIASNLKDAFIEAGTGVGNTYNGAFPSYRIDYILHSKEIMCVDYLTLKVNYSDHFPVIAYLSLK